jgi:ABC-type branched-subunit amino acid transport system substrate-binding protein
LVTSTDHDGRIFGDEMRQQMDEDKVPTVFHLQLSPQAVDYDEIVSRIDRFAVEAVVVRLPPGKVLDFLDAVGELGKDVSILLPWVPGLSAADLASRYSGPILYVTPFDETENQPFALFNQVYEARFGRRATPSAAYSYDAVNLLARSISHCGDGGLSRACIRDKMAGSNGYVGVTGPVSWDNAGGNRSRPLLISIGGGTAEHGGREYVEQHFHPNGSQGN